LGNYTGSSLIQQTDSQTGSGSLAFFVQPVVFLGILHITQLHQGLLWHNTVVHFASFAEEKYGSIPPDNEEGFTNQ